MPVTVTPPLTAPTFTLSLVAGGSLKANTTYYITVCSASLSAYKIHYPIKQQASPPAAEQNIATDAVNKSIKVTFTDGAYAYNVYVSEVPGDYTAVSPRCGLNDCTYTASNTPADYTITAAPNRRSVDSFSQESDMPHGIAKDTGRLCVSGSGDITLQDVYDQIVADGYPNYVAYDGKTFSIKGSFYFEGASAGTLSCANTVFNFVMGHIYAPNTNFVIPLGQWNVTHEYAYNGCQIFGWGEDFTFYSRENIKYYGCFIRAGGGLDITGGATWNRDKITIGKLRNVYVYDNDTFKSNVMDGGIRLLARAAAISDFTLVNRNAYDALDFGNLEVAVSNFTIERGGIFLRGNYNRILEDGIIEQQGITPHIKDCDVTTPVRTLILRNMEFSAVDGIPENQPQMSQYYRWDYAGHETSTWYTYKATVRDINGDVLPGKVLTIKDVDGGEVDGSPFTTDENGEISPYIKGYDIEKAEAVGVYDYTAKTPHTVTIPAGGGYAAFEAKVTINKKIDYDPIVLVVPETPIEHVITCDIEEEVVTCDVED